MKRLFFSVLLIVISISCHSQCKDSIEDSIMNLHPTIYSYEYLDDYYSITLVLLFPDSSFYYEVRSPMWLGYTKGRYTSRGDSLFFNSIQLLDTLAITNVEEYRNIYMDSQSLVIVADERNYIGNSRFIINGKDTLISDTNGILLYDGFIKAIYVSVDDMRHYSKYSVQTPYSNLFIIHVDSEEKLALAMGSVLLLENHLFIKRENSLYECSRKKELKLQDILPTGTQLRPYRRKPLEITVLLKQRLQLKDLSF